VSGRGHPDLRDSKIFVDEIFVLTKEYDDMFWCVNFCREEGIPTYGFKTLQFDIFLMFIIVL
jgi:hypothetical protein